MQLLVPWWFWSIFRTLWSCPVLNTNHNDFSWRMTKVWASLLEVMHSQHIVHETPANYNSVQSSKHMPRFWSQLGKYVQSVFTSPDPKSQNKLDNWARPHCFTLSSSVAKIIPNILTVMAILLQVDESYSRQFGNVTWTSLVDYGKTCEHSNVDA